MLKILGVFMLLCGGAGIGTLQVQQMNKRIKTLRSLICALEIMERELSFRMPLLEEMIFTAGRSSEEPTKSFLLMCGNELKNNPDNLFYEIWDRAAQEHLTSLEKGDFEPVSVLGSVLGRYDDDAQRKAIMQAHGTLTKELTIAQEERCSRGKVCKALGTTVGAFLAILLL